MCEWMGFPSIVANCWTVRDIVWTKNCSPQGVLFFVFFVLTHMSHVSSSSQKWSQICQQIHLRWICQKLGVLVFWTWDSVWFQRCWSVPSSVQRTSASLSPNISVSKVGHWCLKTDQLLMPLRVGRPEYILYIYKVSPSSSSYGPRELSNMGKHFSINQ
jgi:hypothetical protein